MFLVGKEECEAVEKVILSKKYFRYQGKGVETTTSQCEREWCEHLGIAHALLTTSGTNSLVVGMAAFGISPGDEVIIPAYTFVATASAVMQVGAIPIIANIDESLTLDLSDVESKITDKTKAIVAVHMDGLLCDLDGLKKICQKHNLLLVEDAAQACGASYKGKPAGSVGSFGGFSFNVDKVISCGEGGLLTIASKDHHQEYLKALMYHDTACQFGQTNKEQLSSLPTTFGLSTRLNEINAAMLRVQMQRLPSIIEKLRQTKATLIKELKATGLKTLSGHDDQGDIGTTLHLETSDPLKAVDISKKLIAKGFRAGPPYLRPAHACWSWFGGMSKESYFVQELNPYVKSHKDYQYKKQDYLPTLKILSETIRVEINPFESESFIEDFIKAAKEVF